MTKAETLKILAIIKVAYPCSFTKMTNNDLDILTNLWASQFKDYDFNLVAGAINTIISTDISQFAPPIARVKEVCRQISNPNQIDELQAWNCVKKALSNSIYNAKEEFEELPDVCKKIVGSPKQLREWCLLGSDQVDTIIHSNFLKMFRNVEDKQRQIELMPIGVKEKLMIGSDENAKSNI